uniref:Nondiscriminating glutamyl-tRNA synthetase EARS2, mitochondrial n=1 Tax=Anopheles coluzzii TaxID=1518534 RepID=A0A8W7P9P3_ANOCL
MIRTRFAPSPTGYLHIGGVRTALFSWAYARKNNGVFVLRIEDTDLERSTPESVKAIMDGMHWVGLDYDEGPFYQTQRFDRYKEVIQQLLESGHAYRCYCSKEELEAMRAEQEAKGEKPRYDRRWRPEEGKTLPAIPADVEPVIRFRTPLDGTVAWDDAVKGRIEFSNTELDDLIIARPDGSPTYNFCVVINILKALNAPLPVYGHLPMILNEDGQKMSKRRDAVSVVDYADKGILPEALLNYLARLGWGHGDDEFFDMKQFVEWFSLEAVSASASRFNQEKFLWLNAQHIKAADNSRLAALIAPRLAAAGVDTTTGPAIEDVIALVKERIQDLNALAVEVDYFYKKREAAAADVEKHLAGDAVARMGRFADKLAALDSWTAESIHELFKPFCAEEGIKMGQLGMPLRVLVCGTTQTPSVDAVLALIGKEEVLRRLRA